MIRDITIGQYYPADSAIHRLDPRVKFTGTIVYIAALFIVRSYGFLICLAALIFIAALSKVPVKFMAKGLRAVLIIIILTSLLNIFLTGETVIWQWGILHITSEGIRTSIIVISRLIMLIMGASIMTLTTTPAKLTDGIEKMFGPLNKLKVPVHDVAMMISIAIRFIPILLKETDMIMKAQMARGADLDDKSLVKKIKALVPMLVPLFVSAFRRADELALAMDSRCYHGAEGRTHMKPLRYEKRDAAAYIIIFAFFVFIIVMRAAFGW